MFDKVGIVLTGILLLLMLVTELALTVDILLKVIPPSNLSALILPAKSLLETELVSVSFE